MRKFTALVFMACFSLMSSRARAQVSAQVQQMDTVNERRQIESAAHSAETGQSAPDLYPGEQSDVGPQSVLKVKPRRSWFELSADVEYFYTDNMFLERTNTQGADVLVSTIQFAVAPSPYALWGGDFFPRLGFQQQWYDFGLASDHAVNFFDFQTKTPKTGHLSSFDFNAQTIFADGRWTRDNWIVDAGASFRRLMDTESYSQFYREWVPHWGVQRLFPLGDKNLVTVGYEGDLRFTGASFPPPHTGDDFDDRIDQSLFANYTYSLCRYALVQPFYRFQYTRFLKDTEVRQDYRHSLGLAIYCFLTPQISVRTFVGYDLMNSSSHRVPDYRKLDAGGGLNLTFRF
jgi:hypothetical protein